MPQSIASPETKGSAGTSTLRHGRQRLRWAVALGVLLSLVAFVVARQGEGRREEAVFEREVGLFMASYQERRNGAEDVLTSLRLLLHQNPALTRDFFHQVAGVLANRLDVVQGLAWAPRVVHGDRAAWEERIRQDGFPGFQILEGDLIHGPESPPVRAAERPEYFPVLFVEPLSGNESVPGYDIASVAEIRETLDLARDRGRPQVSRAVRLRRDQQLGRAVVVAAPVYGGELDPGSPEARQQQLLGFAIAVVFPDQMLATVQTRAGRPQLDVLLLERQSEGDYLVLAGQGASPGKLVSGDAIAGAFRDRARQELRVGAQQWLMLFRPSAAWNPGLGRWLPLVILATGCLLTGLLAQYLGNSLNRTLEVEALVRQRTTELADANARLQQEVRERMRAQDALARERNLLRMLLDRLPDAVHVTDVHGRYLMLNDAHARLLQIDGERDGLGRLVREVGLKPLAAALDAGSTAALQIGAAELGRESTIRIAPDRDLILLTSRLPLRTVQGDIEGLVVLARDVTEVRRAAHEQAEFNRRLQETQKLESLGLLAGGIAHDFNNLLTTVLGNVGLARMELPPESPVHECLGQIETTAVRAADLCKQMLAYSGKGRFVIRRLDLSHLVEDTTELLRLSISKKAVLKLELAPGLPAVSGDSTQLRQILMNLVINASDAIGDRAGVIRIATGVLAADRAYLEGTAYSTDVEPGEFVFLEVADNGCGMNPETIGRIFDPFFTTKFTGRGLGLAAVLGIVRGHRGAIKVSSEPGKGSSFKLLLPRTDGVAERDAVAQATTAWRGSGTVLVVDDEDALRNIAARLLKKSGFEVEVASNGQEGVNKFAAEPDRFRAVLLDLTMPEMDGEEAFREIRRIRPAARVLLMSGFSHQEAVDRFAGEGLGGFIQKPFGHQQLCEALRTLLEEGNTT